MEPGSLALLAGDASVDSWFREIHVPQAWCVYLGTWLDFHEKNRFCFGVDRNPTLAAASYLATLIWRKDDEDSFSPKVRVRIKDNNNSPHGKFHQFLFPFSSKFSDLNFSSYILYICLYMYYVMCYTQWAWVTYVPTKIICFISRNANLFSEIAVINSNRVHCQLIWRWLASQEHKRFRCFHKRGSARLMKCLQVKSVSNV